MTITPGSEDSMSTTVLKNKIVEKSLLGHYKTGN